MKSRYILNFSKDKIKAPITYQLIKDYNLKVNIINAEKGYLIADIEGSTEDYEKGCNFLKEQSIRFEKFRRHLRFDIEHCISCGACVGVCHYDALTVNSENREIVFNPESCANCGLCIKACPFGLFSFVFNDSRYAEKLY